MLTMQDAPPPDPLRQEVFTLLGRCLLRLQQHERLLKALLVEQEISLAAGSTADPREERRRKFAGQTLGALTSHLHGEVYQGAGQEPSDAPPEGDDDEPVHGCTFSMTFRIPLPDAELEARRAADREFVAMRNELVHHFIDRFDIGKPDGCAAAVDHLRLCMDRIAQHYNALLQRAQAVEGARAEQAAFLRSPAGHDFFFNGITPDGQVHWPVSGIARVLREAARLQSEEGWTRLDQACAWIEQHHPDQTPAKYGCRTWPQVLDASRQFDLRYRLDEQGQRIAWYRPRER